MNVESGLRLILIFSVTFSLAALTGPTSAHFQLPMVQFARAIQQPCQTVGSTGACSEFWYPAGPAMDTEQATILNPSNEYTCLLAATPCLDFPDSPGSSAVLSTCAGAQYLYLTANVPGAGQFCYLRCQTGTCSSSSSWVRAINDATVGLPNYFSWLNTWNSAPAIAGTIRQGFSGSTRSVNPYIASFVQDGYVVGNVYDSLYQSNPLDPSQLMNWMTINTFQFLNASLTYQAPAHTLTTYRFTLRPDIFFQDGKPVTAYDVAFSYLSMVGSGAFLGRGGSAMTGITILGRTQFDIGVNSLGPFVLPNLTGVPIVPGRYWTNAGSSAWDMAVASCTSGPGCSPVQYYLSGPTVNCGPTFNCASFPTALLTINPADTTATFDPIANHIFVGSGPWQCGTVTLSGSGTCTSTGQQNPPFGGNYTLTRFGNGLAPASSVSGIYFRSAGNLALWTWASDGMAAGPSILTLSQIASCFGHPVDLSNPCFHWQEGIGASSSGVVGINQVGIILRFYNVNWIAPFDWLLNPPLGIGMFAPVLYEGSVTLNPASVVGCPNGYDC